LLMKKRGRINEGLAVGIVEGGWFKREKPEKTGDGFKGRGNIKARAPKSGKKNTVKAPALARERLSRGKLVRRSANERALDTGGVAGRRGHQNGTQLTSWGKKGGDHKGHRTYHGIVARGNQQKMGETILRENYEGSCPVGKGGPWGKGIKLSAFSPRKRGMGIVWGNLFKCSSEMKHSTYMPVTFNEKRQGERAPSSGSHLIKNLGSPQEEVGEKGDKIV